MKIPKVTIITPCCRQARLQEIFNSINFDFIYRWIIVYDTSRNRSYTKRYLNHPKILELECSDPGISGNSQRNHGMRIVEDGFLYFIDDDNIIHPDLWNVIPSLDENYYYSWDQLRNKNGDNTDWVLFKNEKGKILRGNTLKVQHIDTSQIIIPKSMIGSLEWKIDDYAADGILIESLYKLNPSAHKYIPKVLCYYNFLDL